MDKIHSFVPLFSKNRFFSRSDLKYKAKNNSTEFFGFINENDYSVIALEESNWYVSIIKPYYNRAVFFLNFKPQKEDFDFSLTDFKEFCDIAFNKANTKERMEYLFSSKLSIKKLEKFMYKIFDLRDEDSFHKAFRKYYL
ncbi:MAG: hypothetical protein QXN71_00170 [Candidatus Aenigmatarchaeota archaeon]